MSHLSGNKALYFLAKKRGLLPQPELARAARQADHEGVSLVTVLEQLPGVDTEQLQKLVTIRQRHARRCVACPAFTFLLPGQDESNTPCEDCGQALRPANTPQRAPAKRPAPSPAQRLPEGSPAPAPHRAREEPRREERREERVEEQGEEEPPKRSFAIAGVRSPTEAESGQHRAVPLRAQFGKILAFPVSGQRNIMVVAGGAFLFLVCGIAVPITLKLLGLIGLVPCALGFLAVVTYLWTYQIRIAQAAMQGSDEMPGWPAPEGFFLTFVRVLCTFLASFGPLMLAGCLLGNTAVGALVSLALMAIGCFYYPMAFMLLATYETADAPFRYAEGFAAIAGALPDYLLLVGFLIGAEFAAGALVALQMNVLSTILPPLLALAIGIYGYAFINLYAFVVSSYGIGLYRYALIQQFQPE